MANQRLTPQEVNHLTSAQTILAELLKICRENGIGFVAQDLALAVHHIDVALGTVSPGVSHVIKH